MSEDEADREETGQGGLEELDALAALADAPAQVGGDTDEDVGDLGALAASGAPRARRDEEDGRIDLRAAASVAAAAATDSQAAYGHTAAAGTAEPRPASPTTGAAAAEPASGGQGKLMLGLVLGFGLGLGAGAALFGGADAAVPSPVVAAPPPAAAVTGPEREPSLEVAPMVAPRPQPSQEARNAELGTAPRPGVQRARGAAGGPTPSRGRERRRAERNGPPPAAAPEPPEAPAAETTAAAVEADEAGDTAVGEATLAAAFGDAPPAAPAAPDDGPPPSRGMDQLLDQALENPGQANRRRQALALGASNLPPSPSREQVTQAMAVLLPAIRGCAMGKSGLATAGIVVRKDGKVMSVRVTGAPFAGTSSGRCMEGVVRRAKFPRFTQPTFRVKFPFNIR